MPPVVAKRHPSCMRAKRHAGVAVVLNSSLLEAPYIRPNYVDKVYYYQVLIPHEWMDKQMDGSMHACVDGWMDMWIDGCCCYCWR